MKTALITGGQQGIGLGIAIALSTSGFRVVLAAELPEESPIVQAALAQLSNAEYLQHDLAEISNCAKLLDTVGAVTCFVSNAGVPAKVRGDLLHVKPESYDFVMEINLRGAFFLAQEVARRMLAATSNDYRSMLFVTSVSAGVVSVERAEYCISKAGAAMMAQLFAIRMASKGVGVFDLRPGIIDTGMTEAVRDKYSKLIAEGLVPAGRWGVPLDIGSVAVPLALGQFGFSSGAVIPIDGGLSIQRF